MNKRTKIVATVGPSTNSKEIIENMIKQGVNVFRINFSHGSHEDHIQAIALIREVDKRLETHSALLADLQGPKIRIGDMPDEGLLLEKKDDFTLYTGDQIPKGKCAFVNYSQLAFDVNEGERILLDDGKIHLEVKKTNQKDEIITEVIAGGVLFSKKGVNLPNTKISTSSLTAKDKADLEVALAQEVDWVGFSFVRTAREIIELRHLIARMNGNAKIIAKRFRWNYPGN